MEEWWVEKEIVMIMNMEADGNMVCIQRAADRLEEETAIAKIKHGKVAGVNGVNPEMVKYEGNTVLEWMTTICDLAWRQGEIRDKWSRQFLCHSTKWGKKIK